LLKGTNKDTSNLRSFLKPALSERPEERPTADDFVESFERLEVDGHLKEKREQSWREIEQSVGEDRHSPWFAPVLRNSRSLLVPMRMGFHADPVDHFAALAYFLNRISEEEPVRKCSLKDIRVSGAIRDPEVLKILWALRNYHAHGHALLFAETKRFVDGFRALSFNDQKALFMEGVALLEKRCQLKRLSALMALLFPVSVTVQHA
jgi:hypothetical protein